MYQNDIHSNFFLFENVLDERSEFERTKIINKRFILRVKKKLEKKRIFKKQNFTFRFLFAKCQYIHNFQACPLINLKRKSFLKIIILSSHLLIKFNEKNDFSSRLTSILFLVPSVYLNLKLNAP